MTDHTLAPGAAAAPPFPSVASMRSAHGEILRRHRDLLAYHDDYGSSALPPEFFAEVEDFISRGRATGALMDDEDERWASQSLLDHWATVLYRAGRTPPEATLEDFDPAHAPELPSASCPYVGLYAFREDQHHLFFGRQRLIEEMLDRLEHARLLAVVGPSGSGKSSAVLAGLLPTLKKSPRFGANGWHQYPPMVPGSDPLASLALATKPADANAAEWVGIHRSGFREDPEHLLRLVRAAADAPALLVVDQFEEVFTLCSDDDLVEAFVANLLALIRAEDHRHTVVLTLRSDFEPQVARLQSFYPLYQRARLQVTPLGAADLREAIEKPGERVGLKFEAGIVDGLVKEILGEPAGLPLLQFALLELWKGRERNRITRDAYRRLGGAREALTLTADRWYEDLLPEDQDTAKRILLRLARPSEGVEVLRNRVRREVLYRTGEARDRIDGVLGRLVAARLLRLQPGETPEDDQVEVAHEALVRNWRRLVQWLEEERAFLRQRQRLTAAAEQWRAHGRDPGGLLGGSLLDEALRYGDLNELETEFVRASLAETERATREKEEALQQQLAAARALAEANRRRARWFGFALGTGGIAAVGLIVMLVMQAEIRAERDRALLRDSLVSLTLRALNLAPDPLPDPLTEQPALDPVGDTTDLFSPGKPADSPQAEPVVLPLVYIQFQGSVSRSLFEDLRTELNQSGYLAPGTERINRAFTSSVRYFHEEDRALADTIAARTEAFLLRQRECPPLTLPVQRVRNLESRVNRGQIEVWVAINCTSRR